VQIHCNQDESQEAMSSINEARKLTAGLVFKCGRAWPGPDVLQVAIENKRKREEFESVAAQRQETAQNKHGQKFLTFRPPCGLSHNCEPWYVIRN
jgi:hypothetical protein